MKTEEAIVELGTQALGFDACNAGLERLVERARKLNSRDRKKFVNEIDDLLQGASNRSERNRIAAARLLVVCLPDSTPVIQRWLSLNSGKWSSEVQFSLLCFLSDSQFVELTRTQKERVLRSIAMFLSSVRSNTAKAAWMAGDLLGSHWNGEEAVDVLLRVLRRARYTAGRCAALQGLERRFHKSHPKTREAIFAAVVRSGESDKSTKIRHLGIRLSKKLTAISKGN